jgi:hypothetical protein
MSSGLGESFTDVDVHANKTGDARARAHGSQAVAEGSNIYLADSVDPASGAGRHVIAHELAHVVQQRGASGLEPGGEARALERDAHRVADVVASGGSARPQLRAQSETAQGYDSYEHKSMGDDVHSVLAPDGKPLTELGGVSRAEMDEQRVNEREGKGPSHAPGRTAQPEKDKVEYVNPDERVDVPQLAVMLKNDPFVSERDRSLTISLRNFQMQRDAAGAYLAMETDSVTGAAQRYDVPVSPGDMTALNGDLYGSMENMRKAPVNELVQLQKVLDLEVAWEKAIAAGRASEKAEPNFDHFWQKATEWREHPVYGAGEKVGVEGEAAGGDTKSYNELALHNEAHFGQETKEKRALEVKVKAGNLDALAAGPQGNFAKGNEEAWMDGHARALLLAREAHTLRSGNATKGERERARDDQYGHELDVPETGLVDPTDGSIHAQPVKGIKRDFADKKEAPTPIARSSNVVTAGTKRNDAYVENAGADHFLTDAFAAGHNIVRDVIGKVTDAFVKSKGDREAFLEFVVLRIQEGAIRDPETAKGDLGTFQRMSRDERTHPERMRRMARGESFWNHFGDGLKQKLDHMMDETKLHGIGAKLVHDYYNRHGMLVHNNKGMTFMLKGDGRADQAPEARQIIAMAVLESRNQITETVEKGTTANPMNVWDYTPSIDKTTFTETSGRKVLDKMFSDSTYLWNLLKDHFSIEEEPKTDEKEASKRNAVERRIEVQHVDVGKAPMHSWLARRHQFVREHSVAVDKTDESTTADYRKIK